MVYPALSLIARLDVAPGYAEMEDFRSLILTCMASRVWKVREMSARAFVTLVSATECPEAISSLLTVESQKQNMLHSNICAVRALLERRVSQSVVERGEEGMSCQLMGT